MNQSPDRIRLAQALAVCAAHRLALNEALDDLRAGPCIATDLARMGKEQRRLLDQFAYRYTRLQDDMGARLMPATLAALGEPVAVLSVIDRLDRLEQLEWLPSAQEWADLRRTRNEFAHDYPETTEQRFEHLQAAIVSAYRALEILAGFERRIHQRFPEIPRVDAGGEPSSRSTGRPEIDLAPSGGGSGAFTEPGAQPSSRSTGRPEIDLAPSGGGSGAFTEPGAQQLHLN